MLLHPTAISDSVRCFSPIGLKRWKFIGAARAAMTAMLLGGACQVVQAQSSVGPNSPSALKKLSLEELMAIEVTSVSKQPEKLLDAASAIQVVTGEDIRRSGATILPEALRLADNLAVAQKNPHSWAISARGFNTELSNKLLVLMDGRTVYTPLFSGVFWDVQDYLLEDVDRIEVISGPGGTLWGANAVNGVINITTRSAQNTQGYFAETGAGSDVQGFAGVRYGGQLAPGVYYRVYGKYFDRDRDVFASGGEATNGWKMGRGGFRIDSVASPQTTLTLQGDLYNGDEEMTTGGTANVSGGNLLGRWTRSLAPDSALTLQAYYDHTHVHNPVAASAFAPAGFLTDDLDTFDLDFQHRFHLPGRQGIVWGLNYRRTNDAVVNAPALAFLPPKLDHDAFSGFVQDEIEFAPNLSLTLGTKLEHNDYTGLEVEPTIRLQWNPTHDQTVWAAVSRAVRIPSRVERDLYQPKPPPTVLAGSADFDSETVIAYEAGYRAQFSREFSGAVSFFYNSYDDVRSLSFTPTTVLPLFFENNLQGETDGLELTADYKVTDRWRLHAGYNLLRENIQVRPGKADINHALNETADPTSQFSLRSTIDLFDTVEFDAALRRVDGLNLNSGGTPASVPGYTELSVRLGWHPTKEIEISLVGQNLLDAHHPEYGVPGPKREEISRGFYGKLTWRY